jgi:hypothetical protein
MPYFLCFLGTYNRYWDICVLLLGTCTGTGYLVVTLMLPPKNLAPVFVFARLAFLGRRRRHEAPLIILACLDFLHSIFFF